MDKPDYYCVSLDNLIEEADKNYKEYKETCKLLGGEYGKDTYRLLIRIELLCEMMIKYFKYQYDFERYK